MAKKHEGMHAHRLKSCSLEQAFAEAWIKENDAECNRHLLTYLLMPAKNAIHPDPDAVSERDAQVAATIIQWLGSEVGQCFYQDVMEKGGKA